MAPSPAVRNPEGKIRLYCKGADTILLERLHPANLELASITTDHLNVSGGQVKGRGACSTGAGGSLLGGRVMGVPVSLLPRLQAPGPDAWCPQEYAGEGLRTLVLAYKDLEEGYYGDWAERLRRASLAPDAREDRLARLYDEVEHDMMVGARKLAWQVGCGPTAPLGSYASFPAAGGHSH